MNNTVYAIHGNIQQMSKCTVIVFRKFYNYSTWILSKNCNYDISKWFLLKQCYKANIFSLKKLSALHFHSSGREILLGRNTQFNIAIKRTLKAFSSLQHVFPTNMKIFLSRNTPRESKESGYRKDVVALWWLFFYKTRIDWTWKNIWNHIVYERKFCF